jgi:arabinofuranosyltransferase
MFMTVRSTNGSILKNGFVVLIILAVVLALVHTFSFVNYITDDAFISFRYLDNFFNSQGLVFNEGERVWGFTNFLWIVLLAPWVGLGIDPLLASRILGILCNLVSLFLVMTFYDQTRPDLKKWSWFSGFYLAFSGAFVLQSLSGLETSFFTLLVLLTIVLYRIFLQRREPRLLFRLGLAAAAAAMTRPEGFFVFGLLLLHFLSERRTFGFVPWSFFSRLLLVFVPIAGGYSFLGYLYYGSLWPNSINAKVGWSGEQFLRGLHYFKIFALNNPVLILVLVLSLLFFKKMGALLRFIIELAVFFVIFNIAVGGDWMFGYRLFHTGILLASLLIPFVMVNIIERFSAWKLSFRMPLAFLIVCISLLLTLAVSQFDRHITYARQEKYVHIGIRAGRWMNRFFKPDSLLATDQAGAVAYYSRLPVVDMMGLNDKVIAHRKAIPKEWRGIEKGSGRYVLSRRPDYIMFGPAPGSEEPLFLSDIEIFLSGEFWRDYREETHNIGKGITLVIFKLRETPNVDPIPKERWDIIEKIAARKMRQSAFRY